MKYLSPATTRALMTARAALLPFGDPWTRAGGVSSRLDMRAISCAITCACRAFLSQATGPPSCSTGHYACVRELYYHHLRTRVARAAATFSLDHSGDRSPRQPRHGWRLFVRESAELSLPSANAVKSGGLTTPLLGSFERHPHERAGVTCTRARGWDCARSTYGGRGYGLALTACGGVYIFGGRLRRTSLTVRRVVTYI
jgi:hypothetical protein